MPIRLFVLPCFHPAVPPVGPQPAGGETVDGWEGGPKPQQHPGASIGPSEAL